MRNAAAGLGVALWSGLLIGIGARVAQARRRQWRAHGEAAELGAGGARRRAGHLQPVAGATVTAILLNLKPTPHG